MSLEVLTLKESRSIAAAAYDPDERTLRITFASDGRHQERTYDYLQVPPETVEEFLDAESTASSSTRGSSRATMFGKWFESGSH